MCQCKGVRGRGSESVQGCEGQGTVCQCRGVRGRGIVSVQGREGKGHCVGEGE